MDQDQSSTASFEVDVVVIGGGIQGLWLLGDLLQAGYNAILLERMQPGFGQTGHSHVFLHQGHMYAGMSRQDQNETLDRIQKVLQANNIWKQELQSGRLQHLTPIASDFYMGFSDATSGENFEALCKRGSLACDEIDPVPPDFGPLTKRVYKAEGLCLDSNRLLNQLLQAGNLADKVGLCEIVNGASDPAGGFRLLGKRDRQKSLRIHAHAVVLSAGSGNEHVQGLFGLNVSTNGSRQQTVKTYMLVVRELNQQLPPTSGMYPDFDGVFMVSRKDSQGRTVWLIADRQRKLVPVPGEISAFDPVSWFKSIKLTLTKLFPRLMDHPEDYEWGIYEAAKAEPWTENDRREGGKFPVNYYFKRMPGMPVWLAWPTLLTFAPLVANLIAQDLASVVAPNSASTDWAVWDNFRTTGLGPQECRWKITPLLSWSDFKRCYAP